MKLKRLNKIFLTMIFALSSLFFSACSIEDLYANTGDYGNFTVTLKNVERFVGTPCLTSKTYSSGCFKFDLGIEISDKITSIKENIKISYVVNIIAAFEDSNGNRQSKKWENLVISFDISSGDGGFTFTATASSFGEASADIQINYAGVSNLLEAAIEPLYIKSVSGKVFIEKPSTSS